MSEQRRLAAIVSADVAGYSRLMGRDESGTLAALKALRQEVVDPAIASHGGRIVKTTGDGLLLEFPSVVNAVRCAVEMQTAMADRTADMADDRRIAFRIGINIGDIIVDGGDIFGDGVNVAARLQEIATLGGICISSRVYEDVRDRLDAAFDDGGPRTLKNIARPIQIWHWRPDSLLSGPAPTTTALPLPDKPSIAVLPFQNMSGDPEQEYFVDGLGEDIITALSRFKSLFVIARNSSFSYKGKSPDVRQVGRELGVRYVLEGSIRRAGGRVRIAGQLIDSATGIHLWADRFESSLEDIFELQDQMTTNVVGAVAPKLNQMEIERAKQKPVENLDAYDCLLRGMAHSYVKTKEAQEKALRLFYRAIELDPEYATPYGLAARVYATRTGSDRLVGKDWEEAEIRRLALRVSAIGRDDALALCWAGFSLVRVCREYDKGAALVDQALLVNQNLAIGWQSRGWVSLFLGQHKAAIEQLTHALRLSPLDPESFQSESAMAFAHLFQGRYHEALEWTGRSDAHHSNWPVAMRAAAAANALAGNLDEARRMVTQLRQMDPQTCIGHLKEFLPYRRSEDMERMIEGLRLAGLPE